MALEPAPFECVTFASERVAWFYNEVDCARKYAPPGFRQHRESPFTSFPAFADSRVRVSAQQEGFSAAKLTEPVAPLCRAPITHSPMNASAFSNTPAAPADLPRRFLGRNAVIALGVVALHVGLIWALQSGLVMRAAEIVVPAEILSQFIDPPVPKPESVPPAAPLPPTPPAPVRKIPPRAPALPPPQPPAGADLTPSPMAPTGVSTPQPSPAPITPPVALAPVAPAAPPVMQLPSGDADYLHNPKPPYPPISRRFNEQGKTIVRVLIGADGLPQRSEILQSSGFDRLDQAALATAMRWRYVPGKRGGVPEAMWFNVPINWVLE